MKKLSRLEKKVLIVLTVIFLLVGSILQSALYYSNHVEEYQEIILTER